MELSQRIALLYDKDTSIAYANLQGLEAISEQEDSLYCYFDDFLSMLSSEKYVIRVRGVRLLCKQAKWDGENKLNQFINRILDALDDEKPTAVRQALAALEDVVKYKKELHGAIAAKVLAIDFLSYKDTMQGLILKDIRKLMQGMEAQSTD